MKKVFSLTVMVLGLAGVCFAISFKSPSSKVVHMKENGNWVSIIAVNGHTTADYTLRHAPYSGNIGGLYQKAAPTAVEQAYFLKH